LRAPPAVDDNSQRYLALRYRTDGVTLLDHEGQEIGAIDVRHGELLRNLKSETQSLRCEAVVSEFANHNKAFIKKNGLPIDINLYGTVEDMQLIGTELSKAGVFLQEPERMREVREYRNPHVFSLENDQQTPFFRQQDVKELMAIQRNVDSIIYAHDTSTLRMTFECDKRVTSHLYRSVMLIEYVCTRWLTVGRYGHSFVFIVTSLTASYSC